MRLLGRRRPGNHSAKMNRGVYIASAVRTPIGKFGGGLADLSAAEMGIIAVREAMRRAFGSAPAERTPGDRTRTESASLPCPVNELILGNARPAGVGPNLARQVAWRSGLGDDVPAFAVNMACASGLRAILLGWQQIMLGDAEVIVAGGTESMSRVPYLLDARWGMRMGHQQLTDAMYRDLRQDRRSWEATVYRMIGRGALWTPEEIKLMADYLGAEYGPAGKSASPR